jgi:hypothetical protein
MVREALQEKKKQRGKRKGRYSHAPQPCPRHERREGEKPKQSVCAAAEKLPPPLPLSYATHAATFNTLKQRKREGKKKQHTTVSEQPL